MRVKLAQGIIADIETQGFNENLGNQHKKYLSKFNGRGDQVSVSMCASWVCLIDVSDEFCFLIWVMFR